MGQWPTQWQLVLVQISIIIINIMVIVVISTRISARRVRTHLRFEARDDVTTAPALAVGDKPSTTATHELRGEKLYTSAVSLLAPGLSTNTTTHLLCSTNHRHAYVCSTVACMRIHCEPKKNTKMFLLSYLPQNLADSDKLWHALSWINLSYSNVCFSPHLNNACALPCKTSNSRFCKNL